MTRRLVTTVAALVAILLGTACAPEALPTPQFFKVDVYLDPAPAELAAWQIEVRDTAGVAELVSVEGGEHPAFAEAPSYDPKAIEQHRIVLAAYQLELGGPKTRTRVATLHFAQELVGQPDFVAELIAATDADGRRIDARVEIEP